MKIYRYFISYMHKSSNNTWGFGRCECERNVSLKSVNDLKDIEADIVEKNDFEEAYIINYILL